MNNKVMLIGFFVLLLVLAGCGQLDVEFEISQDILKEHLIRIDESYRLEFVVKNPTTNTFSGNVTYTYDDNCIEIDLNRDEQPVEVKPKSRQGIIREIQVRGANQKFFDIDDVDDSCLNNPTEVTMTLYDKSGVIKDSFSTKITIIRS